MLSTQTSLLDQAINAADQWRQTVESAGATLEQLNIRFPDGRPVVLRWLPEAIDDGDGTYTGAWLVDT